MSTLYELTDDYLRLLDMADDPDTDEQAFIDTLEAIEGEIEDKADNYAKLIKELENEADGLDKEAKRLTERRDRIRSKIDRMKRSLENAMIATGKIKFKTELFTFGIQKNAPSVVLDFDEKDARAIDELPEAFVNVKKTVNKTAIKEAINAGLEFDFAHLASSESIRIR